MPTLITGGHINPGAYSGHITHDSVLCTLEDAYALPQRHRHPHHRDLDHHSLTPRRPLIRTPPYRRQTRRREGEQQRRDRRTGERQRWGTRPDGSRSAP